MAMPTPDGEQLPREEPMKGGVGAAAEAGGKVLSHALREYKQVGDIAPFVEDLHTPSVAVGLAGGLLVFLALTVVYKTGKLVLKLALMGAILALLGGAYFGWLRTPADLSGALAHPREVIEDARKAAEKVRSELEARERAVEPSGKER